MGAGRDHRPFAAALVTLALAAAWASSVEALSDFDVRAVAVLGLAVFFLLCRLSPTLLAGIPLAAALVTLTLVVVYHYSSDASLSAPSGTGPIAVFGRTVDVVLLSGWLLLLLRIPSNVVRTLVTAATSVAWTRTPPPATPSNVVWALVTAAVTTAYLVHAGLWSPEPAVVVLSYAASGFALFIAFRVAGMHLAGGGWPSGPRQEPRRDRDDRHGAEMDYRPFAVAAALLVTLALAAAWASAAEVLSDFDVRVAAAFVLVFLLLCGPSPPLLAIALAGALVTLAFAVTDASFSPVDADFDVRVAAAFVLVFLLLCGFSPMQLAVVALAAAFVTLTLLAFQPASADVLFDFDLRSSMTETFGRPFDAALLSGCLLLFFRTPAAALLARVTASTASAADDADHRLKLTFAGALVALALAATYTSSPDAFSDFDTTTVAAFGVTVNAALVFLLFFRTVAAALLALLSLAGGFFTLALAVTHFFSADAFSVSGATTVTAAFGVTVNAALLSGLFLLLCRVPANTLLTLITVAGVTTAYVVHTDLWATEPAVVVLLCATSGFALFVAFRVIDDRPRAGAVLSAAALAGLAVVAGHWEPRSEPVSVSGDVSNIRDVSLSRRPNLYFVSFDALVPLTLLNKYFDVDGTGFHTLFDAKFRRFPNFFGNADSTRRTLHTVLALDPQVHNSQTARGRDPMTFSGWSPSPLLGILRSNGYETSTLLDNSYLGRRKGPWVDDYVYFQNRTLCNLLDEEIRPWAFWGYCRWFRREGSHYPRFLDRITSVDAGGEPRFTMAHLLYPSHIANSYRRGDAEAFERFRAQYLRRIETAAEYLDRIVRHVEEDPDAILLVYGDHGMYLSMGMEFDDDPEFFVQDRYGVLGGVFPPDACAPWFDAAAAPGWMTLLDAVHAVLSCLSSDGKGALVEPRAYVIDPGGNPAMRPPSGYRRSAAYADFDDFLYE